MKRKIAILTTLWFSVLLIIVDIAVYNLFIQTATDNERDSLQTKTEVFIGNKSITDLLNESPSYFQTHLPNYDMVRLLDGHGEILKQIGNDKDLLKIEPQSVETVKSEVLKDNGKQFLMLRIPVDSSNKIVGTVEIVERLDALEENRTILISILMLVTIGAIFLSVLSSRYLSKMLIKPISTMSQTMEAVERSLQFSKLPDLPNSSDELGVMSATFNRMMQRLEDSFHRHRQFISDASHELKTPITIIESYARMLIRWGMNNPSTREEAIEAIYGEAVRMKELAHQLLDLASLDDHQQLKLEQVDLKQLCKMTVGSISGIYSREIRVFIPQDLSVVVDLMKMKQILHILLDNALKYSSEPIEIIAEKDEEDGGVVIRVKDKGIGIPDHELEQVFERFYRIDEARNRKTGGIGLGLSIAKRIVQLHNGTIHINSEENVGTEVIVYLPPTTIPGKE
ncbi:HAMP domain-containing sensor histidine kinase [Gorillibacterium massiliense]|uniref:HAMP domain-containing sensor histidine kinase n=1 Tax=Gorillibacterium massiliense TaxID=1280390 RepID=UPI001EE1DF63|nr:HAMP domain-containing histidine kinase [Gorillibacterium massiliense]